MTLDLKEAEPSLFAVATLTRDAELSCRAKGVNKATVKEYASAIKAGASFPPIVVFRDKAGVHHLADGFHRCAAAELAGLAELHADVREGGRREALLHAVSANSSHGLRRTNADKRRAVLLVAAAFPKWSDRKVGEACGVDNKTVAAARRTLATKTEGEEVPQGDGTGANASAEPDSLVARLAKGLDRILKEWPPERRAELRARLLEVCTEPEK